MMHIILKNVRTFHGQPPIALKPLTLLVGENSTGKTTFLAMLAHACQHDFPHFRPSFSVPPFDLGSFDSIATFRGGRGGRADSFSIGFVDQAGQDERKIVATFINHKGQPQLYEATAQGSVGDMAVRVDPSVSQATVRLTSSAVSGPQEVEANVDLHKLPETELSLRFIFQAALSKLVESQPKGGFNLERYIAFLNLLRPARRSVFALAPVRTKPQRTYDQTTGEFDPEGDHIFVLLARLWHEEDSAERSRIIKALSDFGEASTLFNRINVKLLGKKPSDPFQILVALGGPPANLLDVGYGVSQALPVVVQSVVATKGGMLLLQEPEIHLHPRAQAALGSFFAHLVADEGKHLVIETHSDYLADRIRREVADGTIPADDVSILFFDRRKIRTRIHQLALDGDGSILNPPRSYRQFFLQEELSLLDRVGS